MSGVLKDNRPTGAEIVAKLAELQRGIAEVLSMANRSHALSHAEVKAIIARSGDIRERAGHIEDAAKWWDENR